MADGTFAEYTSFLTGSLRKIKRVYDRSLINNKIGTLEPSTTRCDITITTPLGDTVEETNRLEAQTVAAALVVLKADLEDNNRDFNKLGYLRSYPAEELIAVWNVKQHAKITKLDLPTIFHNDINATGGFKEYDLPEKWFGTPATTDLTLTVATGNERILISGWYDVVPTTPATDFVLVTKPTIKSIYLYAGDKIPDTGDEIVDAVRGITVTVTATVVPSEYYYIIDNTIAFVLIHSAALPFMSGFETGTEFWNARSLTTNHYLIFGHNNLEFIEEYPRIRVKVVQEEAAAAGQ